MQRRGSIGDEAFDRVIRELPEAAGTYAGDPASYVYAVAPKLRQRFWRKVTEARSLPLVNGPKKQSGVSRAWSYARRYLMQKVAS